MKIKYNGFDVEGTVAEVRELLSSVNVPLVRTAPLPPATHKPKSSKRKGFRCKKWTKQEERQLLNGFGSGQSIDTLARALGRTRYSIRTRLYINGYRLRSGTMVKQQEKHGKYHKWTESQDKTLVKEYYMGNTTKRIASLLCLPETKVIARIKNKLHKGLLKKRFDETIN